MNYTNINWQKLNGCMKKLDAVQKGSPYPIELLKQEIITSDPDIKYAYAAKLASIVFDKTVDNDVDVNYSWPFSKTWLDNFCSNNGSVRERVKNWLINVRVLDLDAIFLFYCANKGLYAARYFVKRMCMAEPSISDPSFFLQNLNAREHQVTYRPDLQAVYLGEIDMEDDPGCKQLIELFQDTATVDLLFDNLIFDDIASIGGWRNLVLGLNLPDYESCTFWEDSNYYDIGGGHSTPMVSAALNKPFTTLDIIKPAQNIETMSLRRIDNVRTVPLKENERIGYIKKLKEQPYKILNFDTDQFPVHDRITLVSSGSYSVMFNMPNDMENFVTENFQLNLKQHGNRLYGLFRMLKLVDYVSKGRDLEIAMCSRIPRAYLKNRLTYFRWENGQLVDFKSNQHVTTNFSYKWKSRRHATLRGEIRATPEFSPRPITPWPLKYYT